MVTSKDCPLVLGNKRGAKEPEEKRKVLWRVFLGSQSFFAKLEDWRDKSLAGWKLEFQSGQAREVQDETAAEKLLKQGMKALEISSKKLEKKPGPKVVSLLKKLSAL